MQHGLQGSKSGSQVAAGDQAVTQTIDAWSEKLATYRDRIRLEPQSNPIRQLAFDISRALEAGEISQDELAGMAKELCDRALVRRAEHMQNYFGEIDMDARSKEIENMVRQSASEDGSPISYADFSAKWSVPRHGIVFTGHPTFVMSEKLRSVLVRLVACDEGEKQEAREELKDIPHAPDKHVSLIGEHSQVQATIEHAQQAVERINEIIIDVARELYPQEWSTLVPCPIVINCWVGYDLDGRTDIHWSDSYRFRLEEKNIQLDRYISDVKTARAAPAIASNSKTSATLDGLIKVAELEQRQLHQQVMLFGMDLSAPDKLSQAANALTEKHENPLATSMSKVLEELAQAISEADSDEAKLVLTRLRAGLANHGLGTAKIHVRINAMQLHNSIRQSVGLESNANISSRTLMTRIDEMIADVKKVDVNFASLSVERKTAIRQFIFAAQILKHIDGDAPIRLLIAECEHAFTVMVALYYARLFGVEDKLDISPLLETEEALEKGGRIIETLLKSEEYRKQVKRRGRLCIQTGFSDAGRFIGQVPAALAIEKLHGKLADVLVDAGMADVELLIFDTHGESMGRGTHPLSLADRFAYNLSPWIRHRYNERNISLHHEVSYQGGDGYALFGKTSLALAVLTEQLKSADIDEELCKTDTFYTDADFSHDYFEHIKAYQARLFDDENYHETLGALGTNLLSPSGSRKSKRQFDAGGDNRAAPAEMRAIPHNALLQQLGYVLNVVSGIGVALKHRQDRFAELYSGSDRIKRIIKMVVIAKQLSSIKTLVAYASLFDDAYWATRPLNDLEPKLKEPCLLLADLLRGDKRHDGMMHLATYLRDDAVYLHDLLQAIGINLDVDRIDGREELDLLHAVRIALIQHIYLMAAQVPHFSTRNDVSFRAIVSRVLSMHVEDAVTLMREAFPKTMPRASDYTVSETSTYTGSESSDYEEINAKLIDPMVAAHRTILEIGVGISHHFGAHG